MNTNQIIITVLILLIIYQNYPTKKKTNFTNSNEDIPELKKVNKIFADFCQQEIGGSDIQEIRTKLNGRTLTEILEENETWETEVDTLTRTKNELEAELLANSNAWKNRVSEKERTLIRCQTELKEEQEKVNKWFHEYQAETKQKQELTTQLKKQAQQITKLVQEQTQKEQTIIGLNNSYEKLEQKHQQKLTVLTQQLHHSQTTTELSAKKINSLENQLISLAKQKIANKKEALELVKQLETRLAEKESVWQSEKKDLENKIQQITEVPDSWKDINTKFEDLKEEATVREKQFLELVKKDFDNLVENNKELTQKLEQQTKKEVDLEDTIIRLTQSMADLNKELDKEEATPEEVD